MKSKYLFLIVLILLLIPSIWSFLSPGFFLSDDGEWMVIRFSAFYQALVDGQFPVRFLGRLNYGYGYPVANFLYPGFMYLAAPLQILGAGFVNSIKIIMIASMLGGGIFTFAWLSKLFNKKSALIGSIFYTYAPYHLFDLYKRGSVGEILSLMWVTFVLWAIEEKNKFGVSLGIFFLAISHNSLFLMFAPVLFVYSIIRKKLSLGQTIITFGIGIAMPSFFTIPAIIELSYTNFSKIKISDISQYFASLELIGISSIIVFVLSLIVIYLKKFREEREVYLFILISALSIFLSLSVSEVFWKFLPTSLIQFPFRLLSYFVLSSAYLSAYVLFSLKNKKRIMFSPLILIVLFSSLPFLAPKVRFDKGDSYYATNEATTTIKDEYMPAWVLEKPTSHFGQKVEILDDTSLPRNLIYNSKNVSFEVSSDKPKIARVNTVYYPGWQAEINDKKTNIMFDNNLGVMEINLPKGKNRIELRFSETPLRLFSDLISVIAFAVLVFWNKNTISNWLRKYYEKI